LWNVTARQAKNFFLIPKWNDRFHLIATEFKITLNSYSQQLDSSNFSFAKIDIWSFKGSAKIHGYYFKQLKPLSLSSNGTSSLRSKMKGEVVGSSLTGCVCNLPIKKKKLFQAIKESKIYER
jgi:hypothetical protein